MEKKYNTRSPAVKRLMREAQEMSEATSDYSAAPLEENLFEWHFTVRGPDDSEFQGGIYHGRIIVPAEYPMKPPDIILLTPNGRFEVGKKICLSISGHHPETWQPSWSIRTALLAIIAFMPSPGQGTIGSLDYTADERRALARRSRNWSCQLSNCPVQPLLEPSQEGRSDEQQREMEQIAQTVAFKSEEERNKENEMKVKKEEKKQEDVGNDQREKERESPGEPVAQPSVSSFSSSSSSSFSSSTVTTMTSSTTTTTTTTTTTRMRSRPEERREESQSEGSRMYDFLIMLLVAGIAALLFRRINIMQE